MESNASVLYKPGLLLPLILNLVAYLLIFIPLTGKGLVIRGVIAIVLDILVLLLMTVFA